MQMYKVIAKLQFTSFNCAYDIVPSQTRALHTFELSSLRSLRSQAFHSVSGVVVLNSCYTLIKYQRLRQGLLMEAIQYAHWIQVL